MEIRLATSEDADPIASLHTRSWRESYRGSFTDAYLDGDLLAERQGVWRERLTSPSAEQFVGLALDGEELAGFVCAYAGDDPEWGALIDNLHVVAEAKRKGVGRSLMRRAGEWLVSQRPEEGVYLWVLEANAPGRRFYERLGATDQGVTVMETHGSAIVRSCRYTWARPAELARL
ncbi:MAG: GNAT family N-acetyltransferase [Myxococcota bacterium]|nr:GNAT family N-acetyltransferase [Myxococcota bacterium]